MSKAEWNALENKYGRDYMLSINNQFLDSQIAKEKTFVFTSDPKFTTGFMKDEYDYLISKGYKFKEAEGGVYRGTKY